MPPWTDDFFKATKEWADYAQKLAVKHLGEKDGKPVVDLFTAGKYKEAVEEYHKLTPDLKKS